MSEAGRGRGLGLRAAPRPRWGRVLARALLTLTALGALLWWLPTHELWAALRRVRPGVWALVWLSCLAGHVIVALKWRLLLRATGLDVGRREALRAHAAALFANLCLPSLVGGDVVRAGLIARGGRGAAAPAVAGIADRVLDTAALVMLAAIGALLAPAAGQAAALRPLVAAALALLLGVSGALVAARTLDPEWLPERLARALQRLREVLSALIGRRGSALAALGLSLSIQSAFVLLNARLGSAVGIELPLAIWFLAWPLAKLAALMPVSLGGIGVRELALTALLAPFGVAPALAVAQSLVWETVLVATGLSAGGASLWLGQTLRAAPAPVPGDAR